MSQEQNTNEKRLYEVMFKQKQFITESISMRNAIGNILASQDIDEQDLVECRVIANQVGTDNVGNPIYVYD